jgi:Domain of unknown function (DUF5671)
LLTSSHDFSSAAQDLSARRRYSEDRTGATVARGLREDTVTATDELHTFVKEALAQKLPRADVDGALRRSGWSQTQIRGALAEFAEIDFPIPVPRPRPYLDARDAFLYLLLFAMLYTTAYQLGTLIFLLIDQAFPDPAFRTYRSLGGVRNAMRFSIASLIVATPVFLYVSRLTSREIQADPAKRNSKVRRWLTYLTLFVASSVLIGDVIALVYNLLSGELTVRLILKILTIALISGATFTFYLWDIRIDERESRV